MANLLEEWDSDPKKPAVSGTQCPLCKAKLWYKQASTGSPWLYRHLDHVGHAIATGSGNDARMRLCREAHGETFPDHPEFYAYFGMKT